jgi:hypothetical protein
VPISNRLRKRLIIHITEAAVVKVNQKKSRDFQEIDREEDILDILKSKFSSRKLYIKYAIDKTEITINEYLSDGSLMLVTDANYKNEGDSLFIYGLADKYIEFEFKVIEERGPGYFHCVPKGCYKALRGRRDLRFRVAPDEVVATNFKVSKHTIDISVLNIPTSIKVVLEQFQSQNSKMSDFVRVDVFKNDETDPVFLQSKKTGKSMFIANAAEPESYESQSDDFIDLKAVYGEDTPAIIKRNIEKGYKSILLVPLIYTTETMQAVPFAYIQLISKTRTFTADDVLELKNESLKLVDRIKDANTLLIPMRESVVDISRGGAKLKISDKNLQKYILKSKGFVFDLVFKLQAPITIYGEVKASFIDDEGNLYLGVDFEGNSSRKDEMKRYYSILKPMETTYRAKLIKSMKNVEKDYQEP